MTTRRWWLVALVCALLGVGAGVPVAHAVLPAGQGRPLGTQDAGVFDRDHGQPAAAFTLPDLHPGGPALRIPAYRGRPLVLNFWASWCPPCRREMPALEQAARRYGGRIAFVGIDTNDQRPAALAFLRLTGVTYPIAYDPSAATAASYGVFGLPTTFFISAQGKVLGHQIGGVTAARLDQLLRSVYPHLR